MFPNRFFEHVSWHECLAGIRMGLVASTFALLLGLSQASAMSVLPPTFDELVDESANIVRATVISVKPYRTVSRNGTPIIKTRVTWRVERTLKGASDEELILDFLGGSVGLESFEIGGMPKFRVGEQDFLFVEPDKSVICPLIAAGHGRYRVLVDAESGRDYVARDNHVPLDDVSEISGPLHLLEHGSTEDLRSNAIEPGEFEEIVLSTLKRIGGSDAK